jgi:SAM-dependent methyltransferase
MRVPEFLSDLLAPDRPLRPVAEQIWSAMPEGGPDQRYDRRAAAYDRVVGSRFYNRWLWGSSPDAYATFAAQAVQSGRGPMLDAGCGSLVFTAGIYAKADRSLLLLDTSLGMLEAARDRLRAVRGALRDDTVFLQADLQDLPFVPGRFSTVISMGMLHLFEDVEGIVAALERSSEPRGALFLTSLVSETWVGGRYLSLLHRAGEVADPRTQQQLLAAVRRGIRTPFGGIESHVDGSMAFIVVGGPQ